jgi:hypothetical protein
VKSNFLCHEGLAFALLLFFFLGEEYSNTAIYSKTARQQDSKTARQKDRKTERQQDSKTARQQDSKTARQQDRITAIQQ